MSTDKMDAAEAQWREQFMSMRAALAELKIPAAKAQDKPYGSDIDLDDEEFTSGNSGDDVWDFIEESEEDLYSSDPSEETPPEMGASDGNYGPAWLRSKCIGYASRKQGLAAEDLQEQIMALLSSDSGEEELQSTLTDIVGYDDLDFVADLISQRQSMITSPFSPAQDDGIFGKLQTKRQREEALRKRDYEHKHATLGPSLDRDGPQYPHVYKTHSAGNTLDSRGKKYALPMGSERTEREVIIYRLQIFTDSLV